MIKYDMKRLFPRFILLDKNGFALAKAITAGLDYFLEKSLDGIQTLQDVDKMPEWRLDEIAWEYNIPFDYYADVEQKREWVRSAIPMYRIMGTKKAIYQYLEGYFGEIEVEENWQYSGDPFHFRVTVGGEWTPQTEAWATEAINRVKNVRSVLDDFRIGCRCNFAIYATGEIKERFRYPCAGELYAGEYPTENIKWIIDTSGTEAIHVDAYDRRIVYEIAGEKPEINHLLVLDNTPTEAIHADAFDGRVAYEMAGESPEINHILALDNTPIDGKEAEEIVSSIYYPLCGEPICGE